LPGPPTTVVVHLTFAHLPAQSDCDLAFHSFAAEL
jgi:hypothetical protein